MSDVYLAEDEDDYAAEAIIDILYSDGVIDDTQREAADAYSEAVLFARKRGKAAKEESQFSDNDREMLESILFDGLSLDEYAEAITSDTDLVQERFVSTLTELVRIYGL